MKSLSSLVSMLKKKRLHVSLAQVSSCYCRDDSLGIVVPDAVDELGNILSRYFCVHAVLRDTSLISDPDALLMYQARTI